MKPGDKYFIINDSTEKFTKKELNEMYPLAKEDHVVFLPALSIKYTKIGPFNTGDWSEEPYKIVE